MVRSPCPVLSCHRSTDDDTEERPAPRHNVAVLYVLGQGSSTFFSPRTPWLRETLSRDPHPRRPKFRTDIHIFYLELSVSHTHTNTLPYTCLNIMIHNL